MLKNMLGSKYGKLTVLREGELYIHPKSLRTIKRWVCSCDCGNVIEVRQDSLRNGNTKSCGCLRRENGLNRMEDINNKTPKVK